MELCHYETRDSSKCHYVQGLRWCTIFTRCLPTKCHLSPIQCINKGESIYLDLFVLVPNQDMYCPLPVYYWFSTTTQAEDRSFALSYYAQSRLQVLEAIAPRLQHKSKQYLVREEIICYPEKDYNHWRSQTDDNNKHIKDHCDGGGGAERTGGAVEGIAIAAPAAIEEWEE